MPSIFLLCSGENEGERGGGEREEGLLSDENVG